MSENKLNRLHKEILEIADAVITICNKHSLSYYLAEGTLLGAIREQGIIPWDDDIDLIMPRPDYDKLITILKRELPDHMAVITFSDRETHSRYFMQIESDRIQLIEKGHNQPLVRNAWIDIFPLDGVPDGFLPGKYYMLRLMILRLLIQLSQFDQIVDIRRKNRPWHERIIIFLADKFHLGNNLSTDKMMIKFDRFLHRYNTDECERWINPVSAYKAKAIMSKSLFGRGQACLFEGRTWRIPDSPHEMLSQLYGDYMKPPAEADKQNHHIEILNIQEEDVECR